jgi:MFS transporter, ACS family, glucarate transporter
MNPVSAVALAPATRVRYTMLAWFCSLSMITYIDRVCIMQVQGEMQHDLGVSPAQFAFTFSAFALAYALFEIPTGWLGDRIGPRKVLTRIVICWLAFTALTGCVPRAEWDLGFLVLNGGFVLLLLIRFLFGAGEAGAYPNMARAARNWFPYQERGRAQGLVWTFGRFGGSMAPILVFALAMPFEHFGILAGWRGAFLMLGLFGVAWVVGFSLLYRDSPREHPDVNQAERELIETSAAPSDKLPGLSWGSVLSSRTLWMLSIMYFCSNSGWSFFITYVKPYLEKDVGLEGMTLALAAGAPLFFGAIGCVLGGFLTDRQVRIWGPRYGRTLQGIVAYFSGSAFFLIAGLLGPSALSFSLVCLASFVKDFAMAASWSTTIDIGHRYSGTVAGIMNTVGNLGTVVSPPLVMALVSLTGAGESGKLGVSLFYYSMMFFIASACWFFINPTRVIVYSPEDHLRLVDEGILEGGIKPALPTEPDEAIQSASQVTGIVPKDDV